jgi:hypothetical protein
VAGATHRATAVAGVKWNVGGTWLVAANVLRPLTSAGLTTTIVPSVLVEYSFSR